MLLGIVLATVASFVVSALLYAAPPVARVIAAGTRPRPGIPVAAQFASVVLRSLVTACLVAGLLLAAGWHGAGEGVLLGLALATLPAVLLSGAVVHEGTPVPVALIHLTDWILKLVVIGALVGLFA